MARALGITSKGIEWQVKKLKTEGVLQRMGSARGGRWEGTGMGETAQETAPKQPEETRENGEETRENGEKTRGKTRENGEKTREHGGKTREHGGKTGEKILRLIAEDSAISIEEMARALGITSKGVEWQVRKLKAAGVLLRVGPARGGRWEVIS